MIDDAGRDSRAFEISRGNLSTRLAQKRLRVSVKLNTPILTGGWSLTSRLKCRWGVQHWQFPSSFKARSLYVDHSAILFRDVEVTVEVHVMHLVLHACMPAA